MVPELVISSFWLPKTTLPSIMPEFVRIPLPPARSTMPPTRPGVFHDILIVAAGYVAGDGARIGQLVEPVAERYLVADAAGIRHIVIAVFGEDAVRDSAGIGDLVVALVEIDRAADLVRVRQRVIAEAGIDVAEDQARIGERVVAAVERHGAVKSSGIGDRIGAQAVDVLDRIKNAADQSGILDAVRRGATAARCRP